MPLPGPAARGAGRGLIALQRLRAPAKDEGPEGPAQLMDSIANAVPCCTAEPGPEGGSRGQRQGPGAAPAPSAPTPVRPARSQPLPCVLQGPALGGSHCRFPLLLFFSPLSQVRIAFKKGRERGMGGETNRNAPPVPAFDVHHSTTLKQHETSAGSGRGALPAPARRCLLLPAGP